MRRRSASRRPQSLPRPPRKTSDVRVRVVSVGRDRDFTAQGSLDYAERLKRACTIELVELRAESGPAAAEREGKAILAAASKGKEPVEIWSLDLGGRELSSEELAQRVGRLRDSAMSLSLCIGGDEGLSSEVLKTAKFSWCLSRLTLPHRLARLVVTEQLYRAFEILRGTPYHK
jgi:23S rRNA (pseudouridine1915-N3)-methyltransferase